MFVLTRFNCEQLQTSTWAEATALWAACAYVRLVARVLRKAGAVAVDVVAGRLKVVSRFRRNM